MALSTAILQPDLKFRNYTKLANPQISRIYHNPGNHPSDLILLDATVLNDEIWPLLKQIKAGWPQTASLVLADKIEQRQKIKAAGADDVFITDQPIIKLHAVIRKLVACNKDG